MMMRGSGGPACSIKPAVICFSNRIALCAYPGKFLKAFAAPCSRKVIKPLLLVLFEAKINAAARIHVGL